MNTRSDKKSWVKRRGKTNLHEAKRLDGRNQEKTRRNREKTKGGPERVTEEHGDKCPEKKKKRDIAGFTRHEGGSHESGAEDGREGGREEGEAGEDGGRHCD